MDETRRQIELVAGNVQSYREDALRTDATAKRAAERSRKNASRVQDLRDRYVRTEAAGDVLRNVLENRVASLEEARATRDKELADLREQMAHDKGRDAAREAADATGQHALAAVTADRADERKTTREWIALAVKIVTALAALVALATLLARALTGLE